MSRSSRRSLSRLGAALLTGAVLTTTVVSGGSSAQFDPPVTDLEATVFRLGGAAVSGSTAIPGGRTLTPVRLTTSDPEAFPGDGLRFGVAVPGFRINGGRIPAQPAEQVTFRIDGTVVASTVPELRFTELRTDGGTLPAMVFAASGATYAIPLGAVAATRTVARSTVGRPAIAFTPISNGLLPVGNQTRSGVVFSQSFLNGGPSGPPQLVTHTVLDADNVRRNADSPSEELMILGSPAPRYTRQPFLESPGIEVLARVSLRNGGTADVRAVRFDVGGLYGVGGGSFWLMERAPLAAAGSTIEDVTAVIAQVTRSHTATWDELGFTLA